jgi:hypothetical protein
MCILSSYIPAAHGVFGTMEDTQTISREALSDASLCNISGYG